MKLHNNMEDFQNLCVITANYIGIPEDAVKRDYFIVSMLQKLQNSDFSACCVFKGGTSLSKCYPGSIDRFSEDIDLTFLPSDSLSKKQCSKSLKRIEQIMAEGYCIKTIPEERNDRNKSSFVYFDNNADIKVKLEIGSSIRPDPYSLKTMKTYIQECLEHKKLFDLIREYELETVTVNTLAIERTFLDKVMSVKRHAICGTLENKVRHIYDVTKLFAREDICAFMNTPTDLKDLIQKTKSTDAFYLEKRNTAKEYNPLKDYDFESWKSCFDDTIKSRYESLHEDLLYTNQKQNFEDAIRTFEAINEIFAKVKE